MKMTSKRSTEGTEGTELNSGITPRDANKLLIGEIRCVPSVPSVNYH